MQRMTLYGDTKAKKISDPEIDALFERMSPGVADKMTGTHPPKRKPATRSGSKKSK